MKKKYGKEMQMYIGETSRSVYKRGIEHQSDLDQLKPETIAHTEPVKFKIALTSPIYKLIHPTR